MYIKAVPCNKVQKKLNLSQRNEKHFPCRFTYQSHREKFPFVCFETPLHYEDFFPVPFSVHRKHFMLLRLGIFYFFARKKLCAWTFTLTFEFMLTKFSFHSKYSNLVSLKFVRKKGQVQIKLFELFKRRKKI